MEQALPDDNTKIEGSGCPNQAAQIICPKRLVTTQQQKNYGLGILTCKTQAENKLTVVVYKFTTRAGLYLL